MCGFKKRDSGQRAMSTALDAVQRKTIRLTSTHALADGIRVAINRIGHFLNRLAQTAERLSLEAIWAAILSAAFVKGHAERCSSRSCTAIKSSCS
jgi:hypothetical protein